MGTVINLAERRRAMPTPDAEVARNLPRVVRDVLPVLCRRWPAPADWQGRRVLLSAERLTGTVTGWDAHHRLLIVTLDTGGEWLSSVSMLERLPKGGRP